MVENEEVKSARKVFFIFHYERDLWRVNQIRDVPNVTASAAAGFADASLWEAARRQGDDATHQLIDDALEDTSVTVVLVGAETAAQQYVNYAIEKSMERKCGIVTIRIHDLEDQDGNTDEPGAIPPMIEKRRSVIYKYVDQQRLANRIEEAAKAARR